MRPNVGVQLRLSDVGLAAHLTFEGPGSETFMLVLVVFQVVLGDEPHFTNITSVGFQALMLDADMLVNAGLVKHLQTNGTLGGQGGLFVVRHKIVFVLQSYVSRQTGGMDKDLSAEVTFLGHSFVDLFHMPIQGPRGLEHLSAMTI